MERTQIYIDAKDKKILQRIARDRNTTMAELIREAVEDYIAKSQKQEQDILNKTKGLWSDREDIDDSTKYVDNMRQAWNQRLKEHKHGDLSD